MSDQNNKTFLIGQKAEALFNSVFDLTTSRQHYPVKFRRLADKMQEYALEIHSQVIDANSFPKDTPAHITARFDAATRAIAHCDKLFSLIKYSLSKQMISAASCEELSGLCHDVKYMSLSWRKSDL